MTAYYVATTGNDSTGDGSVGNPYASPGKAAGVALTTGDLIWLKSGTYTLTSSTANIAGGRVSLALGVKLEGYLTTTGDLGTKPIINAGAITGITIASQAMGLNQDEAAIVNIEADGNSGAGNNGFSVTGNYQGILRRCIARNCPGSGFIGTVANSSIALCSAFACGVGFSDFGFVYGCYAKSCTSHGFSGWRNVAFCIANANGGNGFITGTGVYPVACVNCVAHGNTGHGFTYGYDLLSWINCIAQSNGGIGFYITGAAAGSPVFINNAHRNNTGGSHYPVFTWPENFITLTVDPFTNAAGEDFSLNNTGGGGAALKALGFPGAFPGTSTVGYLDIGAVQHADPVAVGSGLSMGSFGQSGIGCF